MTSKAITIVIAVIILAAIGYYVFVGEKPVAPGSEAQGTQLAGTESQPGSYDPYMVALWRSTDDAKFTREFKADGTVIDSYEGDASATESGTYTVVVPENEAGFPAPAANFSGMTVIKITFEKTGVMYFGINSLTDTSLTMTNVSGRGNLLTFTRAQ